MAKPNRRTVFVATLVLTVGAMIVDRLFILPKSAAAGDAQPESNGLVVSIPDLPQQSADAASLAMRLESVFPDTQGPGDAGRDAFAVSSAWQDGAARAQGSDNTQSQRTGGLAQRHRLTAVASDGQGLRAMIDDRALVQGQVLDGYTLVAIHEDHVVFASNEGQFVLTLERDL